jgi:hypothetical protein
VLAPGATAPFPIRESPDNEISNPGILRLLALTRLNKICKDICALRNDQNTLQKGQISVNQTETVAFKRRIVSATMFPFSL